MSDEEILDKLKQFGDYLEVGNIFSYCIRWLGWFLIKGLAWLVDGLEGITDDVLSLKGFFMSSQVQEFSQSFRPVLYLILAFSILYIGYMLIMNKKINREQIVMNLFISIAVLVLLGSGMQQADKFTDSAVDAVKAKDQGTMSEKIIKSGLTDVAQFDVHGWKTTELKEPNKVPAANIDKIDITQKIDEDFKINEDDEISSDGADILENKIALTGDGKEGLAELENGWFDFFPELYYRWHWDFWTIAISLFVIGLTLLLVSIKLAKLCYELGFNYILAQIVAPADIGNGQKLKQILQNILNTFLIIIMIFISMRLYLMGTEFINDKLDGMSYLIALIAISIAVVDGPVMAERIFGIDAGLKSSWGALAGGYAASKMAGSTATSLGGMLGKGAKGIGGAGLAAAGLGSGVAAGLLGKKDSKGDSDDKKNSLQEQMKANGVGGKGKKEEAKGQGEGLSKEMKQGNKSDGKEDSAQGATGGNASLQDQMKDAGLKEKALNDKESDASNPNGGTSLQDEMQAAGINSSDSSSQAEVSDGGSGSTDSVGSTSLQDEMQASGFTSSEEDTSSVGSGSGSVDSVGSTSLHDEMQASSFTSSEEDTSSVSSGSGSVDSVGSTSLHDEMQASGFTSSGHGTSSVSSESGSSSQGNFNGSRPSSNNSSSASLGQQMENQPAYKEVAAAREQTGQHQGTVQPTSGTVQRPNTVQPTNSVPQGQSSVQPTSGTVQRPNTVQPTNSVSQGQSSVQPTSGTVQRPNTVQPTNSVSQGQSSVQPTSGTVQRPNTVQPTNSVSQGQSSVQPTSGTVQRPNTVQPTNSVSQGQSSVQPTSSVSQAPNTVQRSSVAPQQLKTTESIPFTVPQEQRVETRTIGTFAKEKITNKINSSTTVQRTKQAYQLGKNTGQSLKNKKGNQ
ncbi:pLS20_p028 family conjugation system transmembrane protein [Priestia megaterium]